MTAYVDFRLRAPTENEAKQAAAAALPAGLDLVRWNAEAEAYDWVLASTRHAFDPNCPGPVVGTEIVTDPEIGEIEAPLRDLDHWYANLRVVLELADAVDGLLTAVGAPLGVEITPETGREWA